jgi:CRP/FNR family transcriptional regulator
MATQPLVDPYRTPFLERMPATSRESILVNSTRISYRSGTIAFQPGDPDFAAILVTGFARLYLMSSEGRQTTIRYVHTGELMGSLFIMRVTFEGFAQMVTNSSVINLNLVTVRRQLEVDPAVGEALAMDLALRLGHTVRTLAVQTFGTVIQRVALDLLDRACGVQMSNGLLQCKVSHQDLADGIGSVRQVVTRALADLRKRGLLETTQGYVTITNPMALERIAFANLAWSRISPAT